jgi:hypothetical protein
MLWLKKLFRTKTKPYQPADDRLGICRIFLQVHSGKKVYVVTRLAKTKALIEAEFPNALVMTSCRATTGWSDHDPDALLCCTYSTRYYPEYLQLCYRLRNVKHPRQVLVYLGNRYPYLLHYASKGQPVW